MLKYISLALLFGLLALYAIGRSVPNPIFWNSLEVTATAYNSTRRQTSGHPFVAAWGDRLKPGIDAIAVSRDLLPLGLDHETEVYIEGLQDPDDPKSIEGPYVVLDKTNRRFRKRIDIYYGVDVEAAREFGVKDVTIYWR